MILHMHSASSDRMKQAQGSAEKLLQDPLAKRAVLGHINGLATMPRASRSAGVAQG
jgi:hypothetical protein